MSVPAGGRQPPSDPPMPGDFNRQGHTRWLRNSKTRTARCDICDGSMAGTDYSYICDYHKCRRRICQACAEGRTPGQTGQIGQHMMREGCWCQYTQETLYPKNGVPPDWRRRFGQATPKKQFARHRKDQVANAKNRATRQVKSGSVQAQTVKEESVGSGGGKKDASVGLFVEQPDEGPYGGYESEQSFRGQSSYQPTLTSARPQRSNAGRGQYAEQSDNDDVYDGGSGYHLYSQPPIDAGNPARQNPPRPTASEAAVQSGQDSATSVKSQEPEPHTTVIVGAGVIGLFVALELAKQADRRQDNHHIVVVDREPKQFTLASGRCAGLLTTHQMPPRLARLVEEIDESWAYVRDGDSTGAGTGMTDGGARIFDQSEMSELVQLESEQGIGVQRMTKPAWLRADPATVLASDSPNTLGLINPRRLAKWLYKQCLELGVRLHFSSEVEQVTGTEVYISTRNGDGRETQIINSCYNLVIAAGPWSQQVVDALYSGNDVQFDSDFAVVEWMRIERRTSGDKDEAVVALNGARTESEFKPALRLVCRKKRQQILIAAERDFDLPSAPDDTSSKGVAPPLARLAEKYIAADGDESAKPPPQGGRVCICTASNDMPVVAKVPASRLGSAEEAGRCNVWLCFGFGYHGTTLAPLVARMMGSLVYGEQQFLDHPLYGLPPHLVSKTESPRADAVREGAPSPPSSQSELSSN